MAGASTHTIGLTQDQADRLEAILRNGGYSLHEVPHARIGARKPGLTVVVYGKGPKVVVQGKGADEFVEFVLEPEVLGEARMGYEAVHDPGRVDPHFGVDESGKGDFFGPLVIAGVYTDGSIAARLEAAGVMDSKRIGSDARIRELAAAIRGIPGLVHERVVVAPERYNALYEKIGNLNRLLAWGHARVVENLAGRVPDCRRALSDQFAANPRTLLSAMMAAGRGLEIEQRVRAESDPAVAAASILAREGFVDWLDAASAREGVELPKGAGPLVTAAGRRFVERHGADGLGRVAKLHFRTASQLTVTTDGL